MAVKALRMAIEARRPAPRSRVGNPYDSAKAERFMRTLEDEQVDGTLYRDLRHARADIGAFIEQVYNTQRLHTALGYRSPVQFQDLHRAELQRRTGKANSAAPDGAANNDLTVDVTRTERGRRCAQPRATRRPGPNSPALAAGARPTSPTGTFMTTENLPAVLLSHPRGAVQRGAARIPAIIAIIATGFFMSPKAPG